jgi:hypothetical protein
MTNLSLELLINSTILTSKLLTKVLIEMCNIEHNVSFNLNLINLIVAKYGNSLKKVTN